MSVDFYSYLIKNGDMSNMPPIQISSRPTDRYILYNKDKTRLDVIAADSYSEDEYSKILLWANPQYYCEFDIPNNTLIRVPFPIDSVIKEIVGQIAQSQI